MMKVTRLLTGAAIGLMALGAGVSFFGFLYLEQNSTGYAGLLIAMGGLFMLLLTVVPAWQTESLRKKEGADVLEIAKLENEFRRTFAEIVGGVILIAGIYFTWQEMGVTRKQLDLVRQGQITERFTRAIEQLASDETSVILGGIYTLERLANDSPEDRGTIIEILSAYVRDQAPLEKEKPQSIIRARADIQTALASLVRLSHVEIEGPRKLDLSRSNLMAVDLRGAKLRGALLNKCWLDWADFTGADLEGAQLGSASLGAAKLRGANLKGVDLDHADLTAADLRDTIGLTEEQLRTARFDQNTRLPAHLSSLNKR